MNAANILDRILDPLAECLTPAAAREIVGFRVDSDTQSRVDELASKSNAGTITQVEREEYRELVEAFDLVAIIKSRARESLARNE